MNESFAFASLVVVATFALIMGAMLLGALSVLSRLLRESHRAILSKDVSHLANANVQETIARRAPLQAARALEESEEDASRAAVQGAARDLLASQGRQLSDEEYFGVGLNGRMQA